MSTLRVDRLVLPALALGAGTAGTVLQTRPDDVVAQTISRSAIFGALLVLPVALAGARLARASGASTAAIGGAADQASAAALAAARSNAFAPARTLASLTVPLAIGSVVGRINHERSFEQGQQDLAQRIAEEAARR